jgi:hypothetical protein
MYLIENIMMALEERRLAVRILDRIRPRPSRVGPRAGLDNVENREINPAAWNQIVIELYRRHPVVYVNSRNEARTFSNSLTFYQFLLF